MNRKVKFDQLAYGLVPGLLLPVLAFIISWMIISGLSLSDYIGNAIKLNRMSSIISLSALPNLLLFFVFIWQNMYRAARGVIFATLVIAMIMLIFKFS